MKTILKTLLIVFTLINMETKTAYVWEKLINTKTGEDIIEICYSDFTFEYWMTYLHTKFGEYSYKEEVKYYE